MDRHSGDARWHTPFASVDGAQGAIASVVQHRELPGNPALSLSDREDSTSACAGFAGDGRCRDDHFANHFDDCQPWAVRSVTLTRIVNVGRPARRARSLATPRHGRSSTGRWLHAADRKSFAAPAAARFRAGTSAPTPAAHSGRKASYSRQCVSLARARCSGSRVVPLQLPT